MVSYPTKCLAAIVLGAGASLINSKTHTGELIGTRAQTIYVETPATPFQMISRDNKPLGTQYLRGRTRELKVEVPIFDTPDLYCAQNARLAAQYLSNNHITPAAAWNLQYHNIAIAAQENLENAKLGDVITFYNPDSDFNGTLDERGNLRLATHAGTIFDVGPTVEPWIYDEYVGERNIKPLSKLAKDRGLQPRQIIRGEGLQNNKNNFLKNLNLPPLSTDKPRVR